MVRDSMDSVFAELQIATRPGRCAMKLLEPRNSMATNDGNR